MRLAHDYWSKCAVCKQVVWLPCWHPDIGSYCHWCASGRFVREIRKYGIKTAKKIQALRELQAQLQEAASL